MDGSRWWSLEVVQHCFFSSGESTGNVEWFSVAVSWGCSMLFFSWLKMASTSSGESTSNAESTLPTGDDGISVMVVLLSSLLRSGGKAKSSVSKSARHRSGNVQAMVVWKRDRQRKPNKLNKLCGQVEVHLEVMKVCEKVSYASSQVLTWCWRDTTWETRCHWLMHGTMKRIGCWDCHWWWWRQHPKNTSCGFDLGRIRHFWWRQQTSDFVGIYV